MIWNENDFENENRNETENLNREEGEAINEKPEEAEMEARASRSQRPGGPHGPMGYGFGHPRWGEGPMPRHGMPPCGFGPRGLMGPGRARPAMRPGFMPEEERAALYEAMTTEERISSQLMRLSHLLRMISGAPDGQRRLMTILMEKGPLSQRELTELAGIRPASVSELALKLEERGYAVRFVNPQDRRSLNIALTEAGMAAAEKLSDSRADLYGHMTEEEKAALLSALETLGERWRGMLPKPDKRFRS
ncbi:MAG: MarR family transcriptional regulator [Clostridia bacterium]|nr:MarR family transcriptional regulator [Clostridia bacterium]